MSPRFVRRNAALILAAVVTLAGARAGAQQAHGARPRHTAAAHDPSLAAARASIRAGIHPHSATDVTVSREAVDRFLANLPQLTQQTRIEPAVVDGQPAGLRIFGLSPADPLAAIGLRNGDVIKAVGGVEIRDAATALGAYALLRQASELPIVVRRGGRDVTINVHVTS